MKGKKCGRKRVLRSLPEHLSHEVVERPLEVGERDALVDDESLDLRELRQVARVGHVSAIDLARREHVDGWLARLHRAHLHRRGVRAQQHAARLGTVELVTRQIADVEGVRRSASGVLRRVLSAVKL